MIEWLTDYTCIISQSISRTLISYIRLIRLLLHRDRAGKYNFSILNGRWWL